MSHTQDTLGQQDWQVTKLASTRQKKTAFVFKRNMMSIWDIKKMIILRQQQPQKYYSIMGCKSKAW